MDKILTIIIPTYNMEALLQKGLNSLIITNKQLFEAIEVLIINDGSKDKSSAIAHSYADKYPSVFRVIDKQNGNYGSCINRGLQEAQGKYIRIMDADDWYNTTDFELFVKDLLTINADKIVTDFTEVRGEENKNVSMPFPAAKVIHMKDLKLVNYVPMHATTYRTQLLRDINYKQTEGMSYTDQEWNWIPLPYIGTIYYLPLNVYQYYVGRNGQTMDPKVMRKAYPQLFHALHRVMEEYVTSLKKCEHADYILDCIKETIIWLYGIAFFTAKMHGDSTCVRDFDMMLESHYPNLFAQLSDLKRSTLFPYAFVKEWRKKGRPNIVPQNHEFIYRLKHCYMCVYTFPKFVAKYITK